MAPDRSRLSIRDREGLGVDAVGPAMKMALLVTSCLALLLASGCAGMRGGRTVAAAGESAATAADVSFLEADLDGDARVSPREFKAWTERNPAVRDGFQAADINGDGVLTLDEWQALVRRPNAAAGASTRTR